jgi:2-hydroxychromene-2-carboxylate isomerase
MQRWAEHWNVPLVMPGGHPNRTVLALRAALASSDLARASHALFGAYWVEGRDLSQPAVVKETLDAAGFDGASLVRAAEGAAVKAELRARTDEALARGVFGAPAFFVAGELFWGQDRLEFVERALGHAPPEPLSPAAGRGRARPRLDFWFDFSSPFAYLASTQVEQLAARANAELQYRPVLLGALFKALGTPNVPLHSFSEAKQRYFRDDMLRFARQYAVPFRFPTHFPLRSVLPLRAALAAGPDTARLVRAFFHAAWAEDENLEDANVLRAICRSVAVDASCVDAATSDAVKSALRANTDAALELGIVGAPSFVVGDVVFWGQDRMPFVSRALGGWRPRAG